MFIKIYENIKKFIKENKKELLIYLILLIVLTYRLPFFIYVGGGTIDLSNRITLNGNETGSYNLAYVKQMNATIPTYLLSFLISKWDVASIDKSTIDDNEDQDDIFLRDKLYLEEANSHAIINAYKLANKKIQVNSILHKVVYINELSNTNIKIGDTLLSINGIKVDDNLSYKDELNKLDNNTKVNVKVMRDNKEVDCYSHVIEIDNEKVLGLYLVKIYDYETEPNIKLEFKNNEAGSSGGFMLSLAIYDRLIEEDLTKGRKIVGTGTIDLDGNIGEISGVKYKLSGAVKEKSDIFFVPKDNYDEALNEKNKYNYDIDLVLVEKLEDAVNYLKNN